MIRRFFASSTILCVMASVSFAQVKLDNKFLEGSTYITRTNVTVDQVLNIAGMDVKSVSRQNMTLRSSLGKRMSDGTLSVRQKFESFQIQLSLPGGIEFSFDSADPNAAVELPQLEALREMYQALAHTGVTTVIGNENCAVSVKLDEDIRNSLSPMASEMVKDQLDPEYLKVVANQEFNQLPSKSVTQGDSWDRTEMGKLGGGQTMIFQTRYTYDGTVEKEGRALDKISSISLSVDYTQDGDSPSPLKVIASDLKIKSSKGTIFFDRNKGRIVESESSVRISGEMTFDAGGNELPAKLDLKMTKKASVGQ